MKHQLLLTTAITAAIALAGCEHQPQRPTPQAQPLSLGDGLMLMGTPRSGAPQSWSYSFSRPGQLPVQMNCVTVNNHTTCH